VAESFTSYSVDNDKTFRAAMKRATEVTQDLRIPFGLILADFYRSEQAIFKLQSPGQYPDFKNGGPNSPYAKRKQKAVGFKYPLLFRKGALANSLLGPNNPGSISSIQNLSMYFGTTIPYAIYHQSDKARKKIPLRKFLFIGPEAPRFATSEQMGRLERWNNIMNDFVLKKLKQESFANG
jgi:hypothetical protein